jgi:hypothetical protein
MKAQNNTKKLKEAGWHRNAMALNLLCHKLNQEIEDFEKKHRVRIVVKPDIDRSLYFEKVFFEETKPNVIVEI